MSDATGPRYLHLEVVYFFVGHPVFSVVFTIFIIEVLVIFGVIFTLGCTNFPLVVPWLCPIRPLCLGTSFSLF